MLTQYALNKLIDNLVRGQANALPATWYVGLFSTIPTRSTSGTEISTGAGYTGYARISKAASLANFSGTQGAGTTSASSGTDDFITNNNAITFSASLAAAWAGIVGVGLFDASSGGNLWHFGYIVDSNGDPITRSFAIGDAVEFAAGTLKFQMS